MQEEKLQYDVISFLRFPLIVFVVFIHINYVLLNNSLSSLRIFSYVSDFFSSQISQCALPAFFFISGFLFFREGMFGKRLFISKLRKRVKTLLVPYLLWNALYLMLLFVLQTIQPGFTLAIKKQLIDLPWYDWLLAFWNISLINGTADSSYGPIVIQFWFIRDLMIIALTAPIIWFLIHKFKTYFILFIALLAISDIVPDTFFIRPYSIYCFMFGAYFSITRRSFIPILRILFLPSLLYWLCVYAAGQIFNYQLPLITGNVSMYAMAVIFMYICCKLIETNTFRVNELLSNSSFFIFAAHELVVALPLYCIKYKLLVPHNDITALGLYFAIAAASVSICVFSYYILRKYLPRFTALITGGR